MASLRAIPYNNHSKKVYREGLTMLRKIFQHTAALAIRHVNAISYSILYILPNSG
jgi:hypothetical protein